MNANDGRYMKQTPLQKIQSIFQERRRTHNAFCDAALCFLLIFGMIVCARGGFGRELVTNSVHVHEAPDWLQERMVEQAIQRVQGVLEWDIRRIEAKFHKTPESFKAQSGLNFEAAALFHRPSQMIHLSPSVTKENFDGIFGHELVHAISWQKYKDSIPKWLEEGMANYIGRKVSPDYAWLANQSHPDVTTLSHPSKDGSKYHYAASTALIEMIASKCSLKDLLQLSVGSRMERYLSTYCELKDLNAQFRQWVAENAKNPTSGISEAHLPWWKRKKFQKK